MTAPYPANTHHSHAGRPGSGVHRMKKPVNFPSPTPIMAPLAPPINMVKQPTPILRPTRSSAISTQLR